MNENMGNRWNAAPEILRTVLRIVIEEYEYLNTIFLSVDNIQIFEKLMDQEKPSFKIRTLEIKLDTIGE